MRRGPGGLTRLAPGLVVLLVLLMVHDSVAEARKRRRRRRRRRSKQTWVVPKGTATHVLKPLESIGVEKGRVAKISERLHKHLAGVPGIKLPALKNVQRFLESRKGATYATCEGDTSCVVKFGQLIKAPLVVAGDLSGLGKGYVLFLRLVNPSTKEVVRKLSVVHGGDVKKEADVLREAAYRLLAPEKFVGRLKLAIDVKGATVFLNGQPLGKAPIAERSVQAGTHALRVTHKAYHDFVRFVHVGFEKSTKVKVSLKMYPIISERMRVKHRDQPSGPLLPGQKVIYRPLPWYKKWWFLTSIGAAVLITSLAVTAGVRRGHIDRDASVTLVR